MSEKPRHPEKVNKPINPIKKKPDWIRSKIVDSQVFFQTKKVVNQNNLVTVCQEANCPNITECWSKKHATFMIMGDTCTRACAFCDVKTGKPTDLDIFEPLKISSYTSKKLTVADKFNGACDTATMESPSLKTIFSVSKVNVSAPVTFISLQPWFTAPILCPCGTKCKSNLLSFDPVGSSAAVLHTIKVKIAYCFPAGTTTKFVLVDPINEFASAICPP